MFFDDVTMVEAEGVYSRVKEIMEAPDPGWKFNHTLKQLVKTGGDTIPTDKWCIRTKLTIASPLGEGHFVLNLFEDASIFITQYYGNTSEAAYNPDIRCLTKWSQVAGWKIPQPSPDVVKEAMGFWKQMWETLLVDSEFLDKRYGLRQSLAIRNMPQEPTNEEE